MESNPLLQIFKRPSLPTWERVVVFVCAIICVGISTHQASSICFAQNPQEVDLPASKLQPVTPDSQPLALDSDDYLKAVEQKMQLVIEQCQGSVVAIARVRKQVEPRQQSLQFRANSNQLPFRVSPPDDPEFVPDGFSTGIVWDSNGTIVTAYHALDNPSENTYYVWHQRRPFFAKIDPKEIQKRETNIAQAEPVAADPFTDIAVLSIQATDLVPMARSTEAPEVARGKMVVHLGNPYGIANDGNISAAWGIISNFNRKTFASSSNSGEPNTSNTLDSYGTLMQIDAGLPYGTSGGAVVDMQGNLIGMTVDYAVSEKQSETGGFAIPVDETFERVVEELIKGDVPTFGFLGIQPENLSAHDRRNGKFGVRVVTVVAGMPGELAGLKEGDLIVSVAGQRVGLRDDLFRELSRRAAQAEVTIGVERAIAGSTETRSVELIARLSKRYVAANRPAFTTKPKWEWRGLQVEYVTALNPEMVQVPGRFEKGVEAMDLGLSSVDRNSPAWQAGLRPGHLIVEVEGKRVRTPEEFRSRLAELGEVPVNMQIWSNGQGVFSASVALP